MLTLVSLLMIKYGFALLGAVRYSAMFTQHEAYVHRGKQWCRNGTPMGNCQIKAVLLWHSDHLAFAVVRAHPHPCLYVNVQVHGACA